MRRWDFDYAPGIITCDLVSLLDLLTIPSQVVRLTVVDGVPPDGTEADAHTWISEPLPAPPLRGALSVDVNQSHTFPRVYIQHSTRILLEIFGKATGKRQELGPLTAWSETSVLGDSADGLNPVSHR